MIRIALRLHRGGLGACAAIGALHALLQSIGYAQLAGTPEARRVFARELETLAAQMVYLLPLPERLDTLGGFLQWRVFGLLPVVFGFWALAAGTGAVRGDEERGLVEQWLGAGVSRAAYVWFRLAGFAVAALAGVTLTCLGALAGAMAVGEPVPAGAVAAQGAALLCLALACFALVLLVAQCWTTRRNALAAAGALLLALFVLNSLARTVAAAAPFRWLSPFAYYERSNALVPGGRFDVPATAALAAAAAGLTFLAALAFARRDLGAPLGTLRARPAPATVEPSPAMVLRLPVLALLAEQRAGLLGWLAGVSLLALFFLSLARSVVDLLARTPGTRAYLQAVAGGALTGDLARAFVGFAWFGTLQLLVALFAIGQVARWASEDAEGRLEMVLAATVPRWRVVAERGLVLAAGCGLVAAAGALGAGAGARLQHIPLSAPGLAGAALLLLPLGLCFGGIGAAVAGRAPRLAVPALAAFAVASYFVQQLGLMFRWPAWVVNLSVFQLYGAPLATGVEWSGLWALLAASAAAWSSAVVTMQRRDVGS